jgi:thioredoxin reductase (NADPH)
MDPSSYPAAFTELDDEQMALVASLGTVRQAPAGTVLFTAGDVAYDWVVVRSGRLEVVRPEIESDGEQLIIGYGPRNFVGEVNMVTRQRPYVTCRVAEDAELIEVPLATFRTSVLTDPRLSDVVLNTFVARRKAFITTAADTIQVIGSMHDQAAVALRDYAQRNGLPHRWLDVDEPAGCARLADLSRTLDVLPIAVTPYGVLEHATPGDLSEALGWTVGQAPTDDVDVVVVGAGPSGLAASVYASSEGLTTLTVDAVAIGGQSGASTRIENYPGFPTGITGQELAMRTAIQAQKFGTILSTPCAVKALRPVAGCFELELNDGTTVVTKAVVAASGARYRRLPVEGIERLEGNGVHYAATEMEARQHVGESVVLVGGGNSAGQGAMFLAERCAEVHISVRRPLEATMSAYLVDRIEAHPRIEVHVGKQVTAVHGDEVLEAITITKDGGEWTIPCTGLFCFIGADPNSQWLDGVICDNSGFVLTDHQLDEALDGGWSGPGRDPLPFETSVPGVFAVGDLRSGSTKRVATAVGDGSAVVRSVHTHLAEVATSR